jgi:hypothetical protein
MNTDALIANDAGSKGIQVVGVITYWTLLSAPSLAKVS